MACCEGLASFVTAWERLRMEWTARSASAGQRKYRGRDDSMRIGANEPAISLFHASLAEAIDTTPCSDAADDRQ